MKKKLKTHTQAKTLTGFRTRSTYEREQDAARSGALWAIMAFAIVAMLLIAKVIS